MPFRYERQIGDEGTSMRNWHQGNPGMPRGAPPRKKDLSLPQTQNSCLTSANRSIVRSMSDLCRLIWCGLIGLFRSRAALEAEILVLRHQLSVVRRKSPKRTTLVSIDRLLLVGLYRLAPGVLDALQIIRPETLMAPRCIIRDRDRVYGGVFAQRLRAMGIRDRPIAPHSPWQNGCAERLIRIDPAGLP
jgi:hypothetical protein